jgi:hypothetical protein
MTRTGLYQFDAQLPSYLVVESENYISNYVSSDKPQINIGQVKKLDYGEIVFDLEAPPGFDIFVETTECRVSYLNREC